MPVPARPRGQCNSFVNASPSHRIPLNVRVVGVLTASCIQHQLRCRVHYAEAAARNGGENFRSGLNLNVKHGRRVLRDVGAQPRGHTQLHPTSRKEERGQSQLAGVRACRHWVQQDGVAICGVGAPPKPHARSRHRITLDECCGDPARDSHDANARLSGWANDKRRRSLQRQHGRHARDRGIVWEASA